MPSTFNPFGLRFVKSLGGTHGSEQNLYPLPNGSACPDLFKGDLVAANAGVVTSIGTGVAPALGVVNGFCWVDPTTKQPQEQKSIPADTSSGGLYNGFTQPAAYVVDMTEAVYMVQADGSVTAGDIGLNFNVTTLGGDTVYGVSRMALDASTRTSAITGSLKLIGLANIPGNTWTDAYPTVYAKVNRSILADTSAF